MNTEKNRLPVRSGSGGKSNFKNHGERSRRISGTGSNPDEGFSFGKMLKNCVISVIIALVVSVVLIVIFALVSYSNADPDKLTFPLALAALYIGAVVCGIITVRKNGEKILLGGLLSGLIFLMMIFMLSLIPEESEFISKLSGLRSVIAHFAVIAAVILGSVFGMKRESKKPSMKHRMPKI